MMLLLLTAIVLALTSCASADVTVAQEETMKAECQALIDDDERLIPGFVRLAFHDCVGDAGCDGCVNLDLNQDGDTPNKGLKRYANALERVYDDFGFEVTRADFWALCSFVAVQEGRTRAPLQDSDDGAPVPIVMRYGREDGCENRPFSTSTANDGKFPNARLGLEHVESWCQSTFGFNQRECVALLGAHTLGRARTTASGYAGPWIRGGQETQFHLDNKYYSEMVNEEWVQRNAGGNTSPRWQYSSPQDRFLMLNTDMCFAKKIEPVADGSETRALSTLVDSDTKPIVQEYIDNNKKWIGEFGAVFDTMIHRTCGTCSALIPPVP